MLLLLRIEADMTAENLQLADVAPPIYCPVQNREGLEVARRQRSNGCGAYPRN